MTSPLLPEAVAQMVADMADGLDMAAEAEVLVIDGLEKYAAMFQADDRDPKTMRALRVYNEAKSNHRRFVNEAYALRTLAAENATLRAENHAAYNAARLAIEASTRKEIELATLRASEAAALERGRKAGLQDALTVLQLPYAHENFTSTTNGVLLENKGETVFWREKEVRRVLTMLVDRVAALTPTADKEPKT